MGLRVALLGFAVALPVAADAPISGPDRQYANFDTRSKVITDRWTHLVWERPSAPYTDKMTFDAAVAYCQSVGTGSMRLPSLKELLTLVDEEPHFEYDGTKNVQRYIDQPAFPQTPAEEFWTSSLKEPGRAFTVDFGTGGTRDAAVGDPRRVRCVDFVP